MLVPYGIGNPVWTPDRYDAFAREVYCQNAISYRCIDIVAKAISSLELYPEKAGDIIEGHPISNLLRRPNPQQAGSRFVYAMIATAKISGNLFLEAVRPLGGKRLPSELYVLRSDRVQVLPGPFGMPQGFRYTADSGRHHEFESDPQTGMGEVFHMRDFHPLDDWYGMSPVKPAARSIDQHSAAASHNQALLQNQARPSGAWIYEPPVVNGVPVPMNPDQITSAENRLFDKYTDPSRRGRPLVLGGYWRYQDLMLSPRDMDFWEGSQQKAREICAAFGVPHVLVVPGEATYANRDSAYLELWENTIIPMARTMLADISIWLSWLYRDDIDLQFDIDKIPALMSRRSVHRQMVVTEWNAGIITLDEARDALDYDPATGDGDKRKASGSSLPALPPPPAGDDPKGIEVKEDGIPERVAGAVSDNEMIELSAPAIQDALRDFGQFAADSVALGIAFDIHDPAVAKFLEEFGATRIKDLVGTTTRQTLAKVLSEAVEEGLDFRKQVQAIRAVFEKATTERARVIARTETVRAANFGAVEGMKQAGIERKEWLSTVDDRTRDSHSAMGGQVVETDSVFTDPITGAKARHPGEFGIPEQDINCRCLAVAVPNEKRDRVEEWKTGEMRRQRYEESLHQALGIAFGIQERQAIQALIAMEKQRVDREFRNTLAGPVGTAAP